MKGHRYRKSFQKISVEKRDFNLCPRLVRASGTLTREESLVLLLGSMGNTDQSRCVERMN